MPSKFKIWDQGHDGQTIAIRLENVAELSRFARVCTGPDRHGNWPSLAAYLDNLRVASAPPLHYERLVELVWLSRHGYPAVQRIPGIRFVVTYSGRLRRSGGYAAQGYCVFDPHGFAIFAQLLGRIVYVDYFPRARSDLLVVRP